MKTKTKESKKEEEFFIPADEESEQITAKSEGWKTETTTSYLLREFEKLEKRVEKLEEKAEWVECAHSICEYYRNGGYRCRNCGKEFRITQTSFTSCKD